MIYLVSKLSQIGLCVQQTQQSSDKYNKMKGQILSRIQSYQNIPINATQSVNRLPSNNNNKLINQAKVMKYAANTNKESPLHIAKLLSSPTKLSAHRFFLNGTTTSSGKKVLGSSSATAKEVKRSLNFDIKTMQKQKGNQVKNYRMPKRQSQKCFQYRTISKDADKQYQNQPNRSNTINTINHHQGLYSQKSIERPHLQTADLLRQVNRQNLAKRKQIMRIYSKADMSKTGKTYMGSQQNIRHIQQTQQHKDPEQTSTKTSNLLMKTATVFKDYKNSPYFNFSNKKFSIKSPNKNPPTKSLNRIPTTMLTEKDDVSIQISGDELCRQLDQTVKQQNLQFGCSQIKQTTMDNDSSFLDVAQKQILTEMQQINKKQECRRRKWKKLPSDFLKA